MRKLIALTLVFTTFSAGAEAGITCPEPPKQVSNDLVTDTKAEIGKLGPLKGAEFENKTKIIAKNIYEQAPNQDLLIISQMAASIFCQFLASSTQLSDEEKLQKIAAFSGQLFDEARKRNAPANPTLPSVSQPEVSVEVPNPGKIKLQYNGAKPENLDVKTTFEFFMAAAPKACTSNPNHDPNWVLGTFLATGFWDSDGSNVGENVIENVNMSWPKMKSIVDGPKGCLYFIGFNTHFLIEFEGVDGNTRRRYFEIQETTQDGKHWTSEVKKHNAKDWPTYEEGKMIVDAWGHKAQKELIQVSEYFAENYTAANARGY
jgi:hypothetical protein